MLLLSLKNDWQPLLFESGRCENSFVDYKKKYEELYYSLRKIWTDPLAAQEDESCSSSSLWPHKTVALNSEPGDLIKIQRLPVFTRCPHGISTDCFSLWFHLLNLCTQEVRCLINFNTHITRHLQPRSFILHSALGITQWLPPFELRGFMSAVLIRSPN